jgi:thiol-disulfide isomerase/thioredoxin
MWLFIGLLVVLAILLIVSFAKARTEKFEGGSATILYFFMPECGHCKKFNPEWEKLQPMIDSKRLPLRLNKIDGTQESNKDLVNQYGVQGFPTIILEIGNSSKKYDGERTAEAVLDWASKEVAM